MARFASLMMKSRTQTLAVGLPIAFLTVIMVVTAAQAQTFQVLHTFTGGLDGATPLTGLTIDRAGNLYGTTAYGGTGACDTQPPNGCGTVFRMVHTGSAWRFQPLYSFGGWTASDGAYPRGRVIVGANGSLYGTTQQGGIPVNCSHTGGLIGCGTVFNLRPMPNPPPTPFTPWLEAVLYRFQSLPDGAAPMGDIAFDQAGNLYGTTEEGGALGNQLAGTIYELLPSQGWTKNTLYSFQQANPLGGVALDESRNIYGTTDIGGPYTGGTVFQLVPSGSGWTLNTLHAFGSSNDGLGVIGGVIFDRAGNLYGATINGTPNGDAYVYELSPLSGGWTYNPIYLIAQSYGGGPAADLVMDAAGNLYGTTRGDNETGNRYGTVFKLTLSNGTWVYTDLHDFTDGSDGGVPYSNVVMDAEGNLYGTASTGGSGCNGTGCGVVWEITP